MFLVSLFHFFLSKKLNLVFLSLSLTLCQMIKGIWFGWFMVFNATFNNISVISWQSVLYVEET